MSKSLTFIAYRQTTLITRLKRFPRPPGRLRVHREAFVEHESSALIMGRREVARAVLPPDWPQSAYSPGRPYGRGGQPRARPRNQGGESVARESLAYLVDSTSAPASVVSGFGKVQYRIRTPLPPDIPTLAPLSPSHRLDP